MLSWVQLVTGVQFSHVHGNLTVASSRTRKGPSKKNALRGRTMAKIQVIIKTKNNQCIKNRTHSSFLWKSKLPRN